MSDPNQVLASPDFSLKADPFIIETDACKLSEGALLCQVQNGVKRVIAYASRAFPKTEQAGASLNRRPMPYFGQLPNSFRIMSVLLTSPFMF